MKYESMLIQVGTAAELDNLVQKIGAASDEGFAFKAVIHIPHTVTSAVGTVNAVFEEWLLYERPAPDPEEELPELSQMDIAYWIAGFDLQHKGMFIDSFPGIRNLDEGAIDAMSKGWLYAKRNPDKPIPKQYRPED